MAMQPTIGQPAKTQRITMPISGIICGGGGALAVERSLQRVPGVTRVYVNPLTEMAYIEFDPSRTQLQELDQAVERVGLQAGEKASV